jgi:hypothetical protein
MIERATGHDGRPVMFHPHWLSERTFYAATFLVGVLGGMMAALTWAI